MVVIIEKVCECFVVLLGINVLVNVVILVMVIVLVGGVDFVCVNQWVNVYIVNEGFIEGVVVKMLCYCSMLCVEYICVFVDSYVKYGSYVIVVDCLIQELMCDVDFFEVDVVIVIGQCMGDSVMMVEIDEICVVMELLFLVGFGVILVNVKQIFGWIQGVIVVSIMKVDGVWWNDVELVWVKYFMLVVQVVLEEV